MPTHMSRRRQLMVLIGGGPRARRRHGGNALGDVRYVFGATATEDPAQRLAHQLREVDALVARAMDLLNAAATVMDAIRADLRDGA